MEQDTQLFVLHLGVQYVFEASGKYSNGHESTHWWLEKYLGVLISILLQGLHVLSTESVEKSGQVRHPLFDPSEQVRQE